MSYSPHFVNIRGETRLMLACAVGDIEAIVDYCEQGDSLSYEVPEWYSLRGHTLFSYLGPERKTSPKEEEQIIEILRILLKHDPPLEGIQRVLRKAEQFEWRRVNGFLRNSLLQKYVHRKAPIPYGDPPHEQRSLDPRGVGVTPSQDPRSIPPRGAGVVGGRCPLTGIKRPSSRCESTLPPAKKKKSPQFQSSFFKKYR